jgi:hypothetical protein
MAFKALPVSYGSALNIPLHILHPLIHKGHPFLGSFVAGKAYVKFSGDEALLFRGMVTMAHAAAAICRASVDIIFFKFCRVILMAAKT